MTIPIIDVVSNGVARQIADVCANIGFVVVTNHGVDPLVLDAA